MWAVNKVRAFQAACRRSRPILSCELSVDSANQSLNRVACNAWPLIVSLVMSAPDYLRASQPTQMYAFSQPQIEWWISSDLNLPLGETTSANESVRLRLSSILAALAAARALDGRHMARRFEVSNTTAFGRPSMRVHFVVRTSLLAFKRGSQ